MRRPFLAVSLVVLVLLGGFGPLGTAPAAAAPECFPQNNRCFEGAFREFWQGHGGLEILGLPISQAFVDDRGLIVQYYERAIMEWHPEKPPEYQVLLTRLGDTLLGQRPERTTAAKTPCLPPDCATLKETGHTLRGPFLQYWQANGGLAVFGFPLTEEFVEKNQADGKEYLVQYFERNRFEYHPEQTNPRYKVLLGLLGLEAWRAQPALATKPAVPVPDYARVVGLPQRLEIPSIKVDAAVESVGVDPTNTMETPTDPFGVGWYRNGARPGQRGNAVIAGHVDYAGIGPVVFWDVRFLVPGAEIFVTDDAGLRWRFLVTRLESYPVEQFPGERVFGGTDETNLNLISCVGDFDPITASYNQRIVIYSRWDGVIPKAAGR
jgi:hypothetical protein